MFARASKPTPRVALVRLDEATCEILQRAFQQCRIETIRLSEDFTTRLLKSKFEGCVVKLDENAPAVLDVVRASPSNRRMILYGIMTAGIDVRIFSKYGINAVLEPSLHRSDVLKVVRATCALLLNELRRYVRLPLVIGAVINSSAGQLSGSSREISGGGISIQMANQPELADKLRLSFDLPQKPTVTIGATVCWQQGDLVGFQFQDSDPGRQIVKDWINSFLGLD